jgi:hypothetical protein
VRQSRPIQIAQKVLDEYLGMAVQAAGSRLRELDTTATLPAPGCAVGSQAG